MKKIKIIELLNKIANKEKVPREIIYNGNHYYNVGNEEQAYYENSELDDCILFLAIYNEKGLNDYVEILEEDKKIYKLDWVEGNTFNKIQENSYLSKKEIELLDSNFKELGNKINEIIEVINERTI